MAHPEFQREGSFLASYFAEEARVAEATIAPITRLEEDLRAAYPGARVPAYPVLRRLAADGLLPAEQRGGVWHYRRAHLPAVAVILGLMAGPAAIPSATTAA